jgi:hypothetical protein
VPHQETRARQLHLGLRRAGDDGVIAVANDDVPDADGDADPAGALDLGAADLNRVAVTDIVLDRGRQPWRCDVQIDGTGAEPPPQRAETADEDDEQGAENHRDALQPATTTQPAAQPDESATEAMKARTGTRQQAPRAMARRRFLIRIPVGVVPFLRLMLAAAPIEIPVVVLGRRIPCHCFSIQAPVIGLSAAGTAAGHGK